MLQVLDDVSTVPCVEAGMRAPMCICRFCKLHLDAAGIWNMIQPRAVYDVVH